MTPARSIPFVVALLACAAAHAQQQPGTPVPTAPALAAPDPHAGALNRCFGLQRSEPKQAVALADGVLAHGDLPVVTEIKAQSCLGMASALGGDIARAVQAADRMEALIEQSPQPPAIALRTFSNAGAIVHASGQVHRALRLYERAERIAAAEESDVAQYKTLINIGIIHAESLDDPEGAEPLFDRALAIAQRIGDSDVVLSYNQGRNLVRLGREREADVAYQRADTEARAADNTLMGLRIAAERAALPHLVEGEATRAQLASILQAQHDLPDPAGEATTLVHLARLQLDAGEAQAALDNARRAEAVARGDAFLHERIDAIRMQVDAQHALGAADAALRDADRAHALELGAMKRHNLDGLAELQARMQDAESEREVERLKLQGEIQALTLERAQAARNWAFASLAAFALAVLAFWAWQRRANRRLKRLSTLDALTGLINRRAATHRLDAVAAGQIASSSARALILLVDIDHFKQVNDRYGHAVGDLILTELSARLKTGCRPDDVVSRWGGEEFLIACGQVTLDQARAVAERLRAGIAEASFPLPDGQRVPVTISIGFAPYPFFPEGDGHDAEAWQDAIRLADRAMYAAKHSGRDAWVGLWGHAANGFDIDAVLRDPVQAERARAIAIASSRTVDWQDAMPGASQR